MAYKWTPPPGFATLEHHGKTYLPGDMVPISKADAEHMMKFTAHVFEGINEPERVSSTGAPMPSLAKAD